MDPAPGHSAAKPASPRTTVRRGAHRAIYERSKILAIIDDAPLCHLGVTTADGPLVLPMAFGRDERHLYLHGAAANGALKAAVDQEVCVTFTFLDSLVFARSAFHNSMNYRSVVVRGRAERLEGDRKVDALRRISDHVVSTWDAGRLPTDSEIRGTLVVAVPLAEASAKERIGDPIDEAQDVGGPWWAGTVAVQLQAGPAIASHDLSEGVPVPPSIRDLAGRPLGASRNE